MSNQLTQSQRLKNAREQDGRIEVEAMTMAQLSKERVTFGAKYVNYTCQHMWDNHPDWTQFMVDRYATSEKKDHQKLMRFVNLKLECVENAQDQMPVMPKGSQSRGSLGQQAKYKAMPRPKAKAKGYSTFQGLVEDHTFELPISDQWEEDFEDVDAAHESFCPEIMTDESTHQNTEVMQSRITNIEHALQQVIRHLENPMPINQGDHHLDQNL